MKTSKKIKYGLLIAAILAWIATTPPSYKKHVKMTVTITTPEGDVSGSAVREISNAAPRFKINWPHGGNPAAVRGEAVVIDLGERGKVFSLITRDGEEARFYEAFPPPNRAPQSDEAMRYYSRLKDGSNVELNKEYWPEFVAFPDMGKPQSITLAWGSQFDARTQKYYPVDNLEELFGDGVKLKGVSLEITDDPITLGVLDENRNPNYKEEFKSWWPKLSAKEKMKKANLFRLRERG